MTTYSQVFGGANIYPSEISYSTIVLTADVVLSWPEETATNQNLATRIIDVTANTSGFSIFMPDAQKAGNGETVLFNNKGASTFVVKDATGVQIVSVASGTAWQIYLTNNTTEGGSWDSLQYGASVSQANASALAGTGIVAVGTLLSQSVPITSFNTSYTASSSDRAKMFNWTSLGSGSFYLPSPPTVGNNWFCYLRNSGSGAINVIPSGITTINNLTNLSLQPGDSAIIASDGSNCYTIGFGQSATFAFDYTSIPVGGTGAYTLSGSELNRIAYDFTGVLTGNRQIIVPATVQQYWISNSTTGAYTLTVKTASGTGIVVAQASRAILYCDGTNVVNAETFNITYPISIANGGTGATSAGGALINLGGTSVGTALFTAFDTAAAWSALGTAPSGVVNGGTF
jgi:hypothetical protein